MDVCPAVSRCFQTVLSFVLLYGFVQPVIGTIALKDNQRPKCHLFSAKKPNAKPNKCNNTGVTLDQVDTIHFHFLSFCE